MPPDKLNPEEQVVDPGTKESSIEPLLAQTSVAAPVGGQALSAQNSSNESKSWQWDSRRLEPAVRFFGIVICLGLIISSIAVLSHGMQQMPKTTSMHR